MSDDGRYIAFDSDASNLVAGDTNEVRDIFVHDRLTGETTRVNVDSAGDSGQWMVVRLRIVRRWALCGFQLVRLQPRAQRHEWTVSTFSCMTV